MSGVSKEPTAAYNEVVAQRAAIGHELFELMVKEEWYGMLTVAFSTFDHELHTMTYFEEPHFRDTEEYGLYNYLGGWEARRIKSAALGESIDNDQFKELVENILREELHKYNVELHWVHRYNWDGDDWVLRIQSKVLVQEGSSD